MPLYKVPALVEITRSSSPSSTPRVHIPPTQAAGLRVQAPSRPPPPRCWVGRPGGGEGGVSLGAPAPPPPPPPPRRGGGTGGGGMDVVPVGPRFLDDVLVDVGLAVVGRGEGA